MIIVRLYGGLGNQMFQYALGRALAIENGTRLWLDLEWFTRIHDPLTTPRSYRLNHFRIRAKVLPYWASKIMTAPDGSPRAMKLFADWPVRLNRVVEKSFAFDPAVLSSRGNLYLDGYWQTERYFQKISDTIRSEFALSAPLTSRRMKIRDELRACETVSVHVRRGDTVTNPNAAKFHGTCSAEWYNVAISQMQQWLGAPRFVIFSDDPEWARANLPRQHGTIYVDPATDGREYEDLWLMADCRHHIIANSSFSWWGAWLNPSLEKKVIAPKRWFLFETDMRDRIPGSWLAI